MNARDCTLQTFLLNHLVGEALPVEIDRTQLPGTIGSMVDPVVWEQCESVRINLCVILPMAEVCCLLNQYFQSIGWKSDIGLDTGGDAVGDVCSEELGGYFGLAAFYESEGGVKTSILNVSLSPVIG